MMIEKLEEIIEQLSYSIQMISEDETLSDTTKTLIVDCLKDKKDEIDSRVTYLKSIQMVFIANDVDSN